ncbi:MAG: beta-hydroxyacyl-ACP dehydratase [Elusimicrobia bacterium]|nr:beta-hydroxyacyl-ACP dehydratase [Elusimicrobiota bacterium]
MRYFLIDRVTEFVAGEKIRGIKNVTLSDEILHDHFPDYPIMPGVLILESAAQLAGFLLETTFNRPGEPPARALLVQIQQAKFYAVSEPGDQLDILVTLTDKLQSAAQVAAEVKVGKKRIARAEMTFMMKNIDFERIHEQRRSLYKLWTKHFKTPPAIL